MKKTKTKAKDRPTWPEPNLEQVTITISLPRTTVRLLEVLVTNADRSVTEVLETLADHAQQGVYRPGAWERRWLEQAFGCDWQEKLELGDPFGRDDEPLSPFFTRPKGWHGPAPANPPPPPAPPKGAK